MGFPALGFVVFFFCFFFNQYLIKSRVSLERSGGEGCSAQGCVWCQRSVLQQPALSVNCHSSQLRILIQANEASISLKSNRLWLYFY